MGECFFWYQPTRVIPDQRPLNGCVCVCVCNVVGIGAFSALTLLAGWQEGQKGIQPAKN